MFIFLRGHWMLGVVALCERMTWFHDSMCKDLRPDFMKIMDE